MTDGVFLDTGFFIAWVNPRDRNHDKAHEVLRVMIEGRWSRIETNDHVLAEVLNWLRAKVRDPAPAHAVLRLLFGSPQKDGLLKTLHRTDAAVYDQALSAYFRYRDQGLSFTDCTILAAMEALRVQTLVTFDRGLEGIVPEVVPAV